MSIQLGKINNLIVNEIAYEGAYLTDHQGNGEVFLKKDELPEGLTTKQSIDVFVYEEQGNLTATTKTPIAQLGDFALLQVTSINKIGAFVDLGIGKELLVPFNEQKPKFELSRSYLVKLYLDKASQRLCGSSNLNKFVKPESTGFKKSQEVSIIIAGRTDLGFKVIVNNEFWGMVFTDQVFKPLFIGQKLQAYVAKVREDGKLDIRLSKPGVAGSNELSDEIYKKLFSENGVIHLGDKSDPVAIKKMFGCSKANFKRAIGHLFKEGKIDLAATKISLIK
ncbi:CvfB family protein [Pseudoalteromonas sp. G4]|uniref:CvfB family protein n=1 Tax=Pseudoalteromonas sp. G4 TaxID=2992761 RepID=UPI00237EB391|nr:S1-like domain-containing RNA-binding protein [Pseudoalteromonas sp. G4]MDE3271286.1 S1-like domain-containing RNA-binding protein [Pseudoalteromonas sp. G4]